MLLDRLGPNESGSGREESTNKWEKQALSLFSPSPGLAEIQKEGSMQEMQEYMCNVLVYMW